MIVFDLVCSHGHRFEAWFASSASFAEQQARGLIACPICNDRAVTKAVMAPRLTAKGNQRSEAPAPNAETGAPVPMTSASDLPVPTEAQLRAMLAAVAAHQAEMLPKSRWVGRDFARAARAMHEGRADAELIHGSVSPQEAEELRADGIPALPLLVPFVPPEQAN